MKKSIRSITSLVIATLIFNFAGCGAKPTISSSEISTISDVITAGASNESNLTSGTASDLISGTEPGKTNTPGNTSSGRGNNKTVNRNITIAKGSSPMDKNLNFGGKTFKMIMWSEMYNDSIKREIAAFESKYNAKIDMDTINFDNYLMTISTALSAGKPYDIITMHGSLYPRAFTAQLCEPLQDAITTADLVSSNAGGIDLEKSKYFAWSNNLYAVTGYKAAPVYLMYYNKMKFSDAGLDDPLDIYNNRVPGKTWDWNQIKDMGQSVTNATNNIYFGDESFREKVFTLANGVKLVNETNGVLNQNLGDAKFFNALKFVQSIDYGPHKILINKGYGADFTALTEGKTFMFASDSNIYSRLANAVQSSSAFNNDINNLGIVPVPFGPDNSEKQYPAGWMVGYSAGRGTSDKRAAVAFLKFSTTWNDPDSSDVTHFNSEQQALVDGLYQNLNYCDFGFSTSSNSLDKILISIEAYTTEGKDISSSINMFTAQAQDIISTSLSAQ